MCDIGLIPHFVHHYIPKSVRIYIYLLFYNSYAYKYASSLNKFNNLNSYPVKYRICNVFSSCHTVTIITMCIDIIKRINYV